MVERVNYGTFKYGKNKIEKVEFVEGIWKNGNPVLYLYFDLDATKGRELFDEIKSNYRYDLSFKCDANKFKLDFWEHKYFVKSKNKYKIGVAIINQKETFWEKYKNYIRVALWGIFLFILATVSTLVIGDCYKDYTGDVNIEEKVQEESSK